MSHRGPDLALAGSAPLDELVTTLRTVISLAESGQWDEIPEFDQKILALLKQLQDGNSLLTPAQIREAISLNQDALIRCKERMKSIEPLIKAFDTNTPEIRK